MLWAQWYTRIVGIFFVLVAITLIADYATHGFRPETMHKIFHVALGIAVIGYGWKNPAWWRLFPLISGAFFLFVACFGVLFPDFGALDAFNRIDTILHALVGISGTLIGAYAAHASHRHA